MSLSFIPSEGFTEVQYESVLRASSTSNQEPTSLDTPITVSFGAAQGGSTDPIQLDADGTLTVNQSGLYFVRLNLQYGRTGANGTSWIYFRTTIAPDGINYVQGGRTVLTKLVNSSSSFSFQNVSVSSFQEGWKIRVEVMRGSEGNNTGGLIATDPLEASWSVSPSAEITMQKIALN